MFFENKNIINMKKGAEQIERIYKGDNAVWAFNIISMFLSEKRPANDEDFFSAPYNYYDAFYRFANYSEDNNTEYKVSSFLTPNIDELNSKLSEIKNFYIGLAWFGKERETGDVVAQYNSWMFRASNMAKDGKALTPHHIAKCVRQIKQGNRPIYKPTVGIFKGVRFIGEGDPYAGVVIIEKL